MAEGDAGSIAIRADTLRLAGEPSLDPDGSGALVSSRTLGSGDAGRIDVDAGTLDLAFGFIRSGTSGAGDAGEIAIAADIVRLDLISEIATTADFGSAGDAGSIVIQARDFALRDASAINSAANGSGRAGRIAVTADAMLIDSLGGIASSAGLDAEAAGTIDLVGRDIRVDNAFISSSTFGAGPGGGIAIAADSLAVTEFSRLLSSTFGSGPGGEVAIDAGSIDLSMGADIASRAEEGSTGDAGTVRVTADALVVRSAAGLSSSAIGSGAAGAVLVEAETVLVDGGDISSASTSEESGPSGSNFVGAPRIEIVGGEIVSTVSRNTNPAGAIFLMADASSCAAKGPRSRAPTCSTRPATPARCLITTGRLTIADGAEISTASVAGAAGDITILMPDDGLLTLEGAELPGTITTSSGPGTGGRITIAAPRAIISNGGRILALGESGGANVRINTLFFISSSDRPNMVAVDGSFLLEAQVGDVSRGTVERDLSVIDASGVLRGQCAAVRATGQVSQLVVRPVGPYGRARDGGGDSLPLGPCV